MVYAEITDINFTSGIIPLIQYANNAAEGWVMNGLLIFIYIVFAFGYYMAKKDLFGGIAVAGFMTFLFALLFLTAELINPVTFTITIAVFILGSIGLFLGKRD